MNALSEEQRSLVHINETIELTLRLRTHGFRAAGVDIVTELEPGLPPIEADNVKLQQVLLNLFVNAEQAKSVRQPVAFLDEITVREQMAPEQMAFTPENIEFPVVAESAGWLVIDKQDVDLVGGFHVHDAPAVSTMEPHPQSG